MVIVMRFDPQFPLPPFLAFALTFFFLFYIYIPLSIFESLEYCIWQNSIYLIILLSQSIEYILKCFFVLSFVLVLIFFFLFILSQLLLRY